MAQFTWKVTVSYGLGGNMEIEVQAPTQAKARKVAEQQTGYKALKATR